MLIADAEQLAVRFARAEPQLNLRRELIRLEAERVLHVTVRLERSWRGRQAAVRARPTGIALTLGLDIATDTLAVLETPGDLWIQITHFLCVQTTGRTTLRQSRVGQVVQNSVVLKTAYVPLETDPDWHVLPAAVSVVELVP